MLLFSCLLFSVCTSAQKTYVSTTDSILPLAKFQQAKDSTLSAQQIFARHLDALGGVEKLGSIKTIYESSLVIANADTITSEGWYRLGKKSLIIQRYRKKGYMWCYSMPEAGICAVFDSNSPKKDSDQLVDNYPLQKHGASPDRLLYGHSYYSMPNVLSTFVGSQLQATRHDLPQDPYYQVMVTMKDSSTQFLFIDPFTFLVKLSVLDDYLTKATFLTEYSNFSDKDGYCSPSKEVTFRLVSINPFQSDPNYAQALLRREIDPDLPWGTFRIPPKVVQSYRNDFPDDPFPAEEYCEN